MTIEEMKLLKVGDLVEDLELPKNINYLGRIICKVDSINENGITISSIQKGFENSYPNRFNINEHNKLKFI